MKWDWNHFLTKLTSRKFWVWLATTGIAYRVLKSTSENHSWITPVIIVWGIISCLYLCGEVIIDAIGKAIEKANIELNLGTKK